MSFDSQPRPLGTPHRGFRSEDVEQSVAARWATFLSLALAEVDHFGTPAVVSSRIFGRP